MSVAEHVTMEGETVETVFELVPDYVLESPLEPEAEAA